MGHTEGVVFLRREISLKVICESQIFNLIFAIIFVTTNENTYILFLNILNDVQTKDKGEINKAQHNYPKIVYFNTILVEGLKSKMSINSTTVFNHQIM